MKNSLIETIKTKYPIVSRANNGLEETLKAVKSLLSFKNSNENNNLLKLVKPSHEIPPLQNISGASILFKEHKRRSLLASKSEKLIPFTKSSAALPTAKVNLIPPI